MFGLHYISLIMHELSMDIITDGIKQCHCQQMSACYVLSSIAICATLVHISMNHYFTCSGKFVVINCIYSYIQGFSLTPVRLRELDMKLVSFPMQPSARPPSKKGGGSGEYSTKFFEHLGILEVTIDSVANYLVCTRLP